MKQTVILISIALLGLFVYGRYAASAAGTVLTPMLLEGTKWGPEHLAGKYVTFNADGTYTGKEEYVQDSKDISGTYTITGGKVNLLDGKGAPYLTGGVLKEERASLRFTNCLQFGNGTRLWDLNSTVQPEVPVTIGGTRAVTMGLKKGNATTNAKFRTGPALTAREIRFKVFSSTGEGLDEAQVPYLPKGTAVVVLARTVGKVRVQKWENYWYYIEAEEPVDSWKTGWVFAEFIQLN